MNTDRKRQGSQLTRTASDKPGRRGKIWRWLGYLLLFIVLAIGVAQWQRVRLINAALWGFQPAEMAAAQYQSKTLRANLGGMPVAIPWYFAEYVEYDGDPGFGEKRKGPRPVRTPESRIASFGFDMRYPDMAGLETWAMRAERRRKYRAWNTPWVGVTIISGELYSGDGSIDRLASGQLEPSPNYPQFNYSPRPGRFHGLEVYVQSNIDKRTGRPYGEGDGGQDLFIAREADGHVKAVIKCANRKVPAPPCQHDFNLEPKAEINVTVNYRRQLLPQWRDIQEKVRQRILSFEIPPGQSESPASLEAARHRREREQQQQRQTQPGKHPNRIDSGGVEAASILTEGGRRKGPTQTPH
jgi:hypothetical protein